MSFLQTGPVIASPLAIVRFEKDENVDQILTGIADALKRDNLNVAGYLQRELNTGKSGCCSDVFLEDIGSGARFQITQSLGAGSRGCRLDPRGMVEAVSHLSDEINGDTDILILNRFGKGEEDGQGFRSIIETAFLSGLPTLIAVRQAYIDAWQQFAGDDYSTLSADKDEVLGWCFERIAEQHWLKSA